MRQTKHPRQGNGRCGSLASAGAASPTPIAESSLLHLYEVLNRRYGDLHWWPAETPFEMMVGAILTQNTIWRQVEKVIGKLKTEGLLTPAGIDALGEEELAERLRPTGYFHQKARRLQGFVRFLVQNHGGEPLRLFSGPPATARTTLLSLSGIGPETADSMLLYAGQFPSFVIDAYTRRILLRHALIDVRDNYDRIQRYFMERLPAEPDLFNQYHALFVEVGKRHCRKKAWCADCPVAEALGLPPGATLQENGP